MGNNIGEDFHKYAEKETKRIYDLVGEKRRQGHSCTRILECYPPKLSWCEQVKCTNLITVVEKTVVEKEEILKKQKLKESIKNFIEKLEQDNHKCIVKIDNSPYVEWCNNKICNKLK